MHRNESQLITNHILNPILFCLPYSASFHIESSKLLAHESNLNIDSESDSLSSGDQDIVKSLRQAYSIFVKRECIKQYFIKLN